MSAVFHEVALDMKGVNMIQTKHKVAECSHVQILAAVHIYLTLAINKKQDGKRYFKLVVSGCFSLHIPSVLAQCH